MELRLRGLVNTVGVIAWLRRGNADCDFQPRRRPKRTESGLSDRQFEFKSFTIIVGRNRTGFRRKIAD